MEVTIFTDGAARGNPEGPGGYGVVLQYVDKKGQLHEKELSCGYKKTTNNRMELMAAIRGLQELNCPCDVILYSDSKYLVDAFNSYWIDNWQRNGWKKSDKKPVKNVDLWQTLLAAMKPHRVTSVGSRATTAIRKMSAATHWPPRRRTGTTCWRMWN